MGDPYGTNGLGRQVARCQLLTILVVTLPNKRRPLSSQRLCAFSLRKFQMPSFLTEAQPEAISSGFLSVRVWAVSSASLLEGIALKVDGQWLLIIRLHFRLILGSCVFWAALHGPVAPTDDPKNSDLSSFCITADLKRHSRQRGTSGLLHDSMSTTEACLHV